MPTQPQNLPNTIGSRLLFARNALGLSHEDVSESVGINPQLLVELENDQHQATGFVYQLATIYKVSPRWLAEGKGPRALSVLELLDDPDVQNLVEQYSLECSENQKRIQEFMRQIK